MVTVTVAKVVSNTQLSSSVNSIVFSVPKSFSFVAGQFVMVRVGKVGRPYSIASAPFESGVELCIKRAGVFSNLMCDLKVGSSVKFVGPNGAFTLVNSKKKSELIFVATGTGIAPIKSMLTDFFERGDSRRVSLYFGVRKKVDILYFGLFSKWAKDHENFSFIPCLSRASPSWKDEQGHVDEVLGKYVSDAKGKELYLCGLPAMVDGVEKLAKKIGFKKNQIFHERFV